MTTKILGEEGFKWFIGVVEDRDDPEKRGRVRVRVYNLHDENKANAPTESLPWATVILPPISASLKQVGISATGLAVGSTVLGFFLDGREANIPVIFGSIPGIGDIPQLASDQPLINKEQIGPEPPSAFAAKFPYNKVVRTESGHVFEVDDTPNAQRIHNYHRSGTYEEINVDGRRVTKVVGDDFEIVVKDKTLFVQGNINIEARGSISVTSPQSVTITTPTVQINGQLKVSGSITTPSSITATGPITGAGIGLSTHTHTGVQGGPSSTGGPSG